ncbi:MAG TPA: hypothetical protein VGD99_12725 [Anaerolineae bacterium]
MPQVVWAKFLKPFLILFYALIFIFIWINTSLASAPGDLDTSFNGTGIITTSISSMSDGGFAIVIQPDDKIVVAGASNSQEDFVIVRYNPNGSLDTDFNSTGVVTTSIGNGTEAGLSIALQSDNKIVVAGAGTSDQLNSDFAVLRYNVNGSLDTDFNSTGVVTTRVGSGIDVGNGVVIQANNKIVVTGYAENNQGAKDIAIVRYNPNGSLDTSFKGTGIITTSIDNMPFGDERGEAVFIQADGKIVVAGSTGSQFVVLRYTTSGDLDVGFNGTGVVTTSVGSSSGGTSAAIQADGKIVVVGSTGTGANTDFAVVRYTTNGALDTTFNGTGIVTTDISSGFDRAQVVIIQPNNKIIVAGTSNFGMNTGDFTIVRYHSDGSLDTVFGNGGIVTTTISTNRDEAHGATIQSDGRVVIAGFENTTGNANDDINIAVARYIGNSITYLPIVLKE